MPILNQILFNGVSISDLNMPKTKKIIPKKVIQKKNFYKRRKSRGFFSDLYQELVN